MNRDRISLYVLGGLGFVLLLSLLLYLFWPGSLKRTVLYFPREIGGGIAEEVRSLPWSWEREANAELLVKEVLLGPARHENVRLFARTAQVKHVLFRNDTLYIDLTISSLFPDVDVVYSPRKALDVLKQTILTNLRDCSKVVITVDGQAVLDKIR